MRGRRLAAVAVAPAPAAPEAGCAAAQAINEHLPATVKVLAAQRVNRNFDARERCGERTYHYWLPASAMGVAMGGAASLPPPPPPVAQGCCVRGGGVRGHVGGAAMPSSDEQHPPRPRQPLCGPSS